jgi:LEA14-like dessication related protein
MNKKILIVIAVIILLLVFPLYQLYALNSTTIQNFQIHHIEMNNRLQFEVEGSFDVYNPSFISITVKEVTYSATIDNEEVFVGTLQPGTITSKTATEQTFIHTIDWVPDEATVQDILNDEDIILVIETDAKGSYLYFFTLSGEKTIEINITQMVKPYVEEMVNSLTKLLAGLVF